MRKNKMTEKHFFKPGEYWIGDPCYAVKDENWNELCDNTGCFGLELEKFPPNWQSGLFKYNDQLCFTYKTKYGDGTYYDNKGNEYGVDAGLIGIMPIECCDGDSMYGGVKHNFYGEFQVWENNGKFYFGSIEIDTDDDIGDFWNEDSEY